MADRIAYSRTVKINLGNWESTDVYFSYSSDVKEGEKLSEAITRVHNVVEQVLEKKEARIRQNVRD